MNAQPSADAVNSDALFLYTEKSRTFLPWAIHFAAMPDVISFAAFKTTTPSSFWKFKIFVFASMYSL